MGNVGKAAAYALFNRRAVSELVLLDLDRDATEGEAMDLMHGQALTGRITVRAGDYEDLAAAQIIVITAGVSQKPGETRLDLLGRNADVFKHIAGRIDHYAPNAHLIIATNPVDILTYIMQELSTRPNDRIIGTGTMLDTSRFRALLGARYNVDPRSVHAYILGEHGDSEVPIWSGADIGGRRLQDHTVLGQSFHPDEMQILFEQVRDAAYAIIDRKGFTDKAIGVVIARLVEIILNDQRSVVPVSVRLEGEYGISDVCLSIPSVVGRNGIEGRILPELNETEHHRLQASADILRESLHALVDRM